MTATRIAPVPSSRAATIEMTVAPALPPATKAMAAGRLLPPAATSPSASAVVALLLVRKVPMTNPTVVMASGEAPSVVEDEDEGLALEHRRHRVDDQRQAEEQQPRAQEQLAGRCARAASVARKKPTPIIGRA
jgi:hypothetical protein